jgi:AcrR family transcriptional regulator
MGSFSRLTPRQLSVIPHFIGCASIEEACRRAKVSKPTLYKWLKDEHFKAELSRQREEIYKESLETLRAGGKRAVEKLLKLIDSKRDDIALRACSQVISANIRLKELEGSDIDSDGGTPFTVENVTAAWLELSKQEESQRTEPAPAVLQLTRFIR